MDGVLIKKLADLGLRDKSAVTQNRLGDCSFLCFAKCMSDADQRPVGITMHGTKMLIVLPSKKGAEILEGEHMVDVASVESLRKLVADQARDMLASANSKTESLKRHIRHSFRSACMREHDNAFLEEDPLGAESTESDERKVWAKLMEGKGMIQLKYYALRSQPRYIVHK